MHIIVGPYMHGTGLKRDRTDGTGTGTWHSSSTFPSPTIPSYHCPFCSSLPLFFREALYSHIPSYSLPAYPIAPIVCCVPFPIGLQPLWPLSPLTDLTLTPGRPCLSLFCLLHYYYSYWPHLPFPTVPHSLLPAHSSPTHLFFTFFYSVPLPTTRFYYNTFGRLHLLFTLLGVYCLVLLVLRHLLFWFPLPLCACLRLLWDGDGLLPCHLHTLRYVDGGIVALFCCACTLFCHFVVLPFYYCLRYTFMPAAQEPRSTFSSMRAVPTATCLALPLIPLHLPTFCCSLRCVLLPLLPSLDISFYHMPLGVDYLYPHCCGTPAHRFIHFTALPLLLHLFVICLYTICRTAFLISCLSSPSLILLSFSLPDPGFSPSLIIPLPFPKNMPADTFIFILIHMHYTSHTPSPCPLTP